jgi:hypothetical protein
MVRKALMNLKQDAYEGEVRHHATSHDEDLDESGVFEKNEPFPPNVIRP